MRVPLQKRFSPCPSQAVLEFARVDVVVKIRADDTVKLASQQGRVDLVYVSSGVGVFGLVQHAGQGRVEVKLVSLISPDCGHDAGGAARGQLSLACSTIRRKKKTEEHTS